MLRSSYTELETRASTGRIFVLIAMAIHIIASVLSMVGLQVNAASVVISWGIQIGLCCALFAGRNWSRWVLFALNIFGVVMLSWLMFAKPEIMNPAAIGRAALCVVVAVLLVLPGTSAYIAFKSLRF